MLIPRSLSEHRGNAGGPRVVRRVLRRQRERFADLLAELSPADWQQPSRRDGWSVHDVARQVRAEAAAIDVATPDSPARIVGDLRRLAAEKAHRPADLFTIGPSGRRVHWSVRTLHTLWDARRHEADVAVALGRTVRSDDAELQLAILYGLLLAATPPALSGAPVDTAILLTGSPSGVYTVTHTADGITITAGTRRAELRADTAAVLEERVLFGRPAAV